MNTSATGDNTPAAKRLKTSASTRTPVAIIPNNLALARIQAEGEEASAAVEEATDKEDIKMDDEPTALAGPEPALLPCSLELPPTAFTLFSVTITKKVTLLLMMKRAKLCIIKATRDRPRFHPL
jgi:hypothetical protein